MINHILYYTSATKGKLNGEHEYSTEEANLLFKLARLKIKIVQKNTIPSSCPLITAIFVMYSGKGLVMPIISRN